MVSGRGLGRLVIRYLVFFFTVVVSLTNATEYMPWFGNVLEFENRISYVHQRYDEVDTASGSLDRSSRDHFLDFSLVFTTLNDMSLEAELGLANTSQRGFGMENLKATGRVLLSNDIIGDPFSLTAGASLLWVFEDGLDDISTPHHGEIGLELHTAIGRELAIERFWETRYWAMMGVGLANRGVLWTQSQWAIETKMDDHHIGRLFVNSRSGIGDRKLSFDKPFGGYGLIQHRMLEGGVRYHHGLPFLGALVFEYTYRVYAHSSPDNVHRFILQFLHSFSF